MSTEASTMSHQPSAISQVEGRALPLRGHDIDTDRIMPARFLVAVSFEGLERHLFEDDRKANPAHPFNDSRYSGASILVVNANFGCGSSREHAPQGLVRAGYRAIVGESFSEIFQGNAAMLGMPCFVADHDDVDRLQSLIEEMPDVVVAADVASGNVAAGPHPFHGDAAGRPARRIPVRSVEPDRDAAGSIRRRPRRRGQAAVRQRLLTRLRTGDFCFMRRVAMATVILGAIALSARAQPPRESPSAPAPQKRVLSGRVLTDGTGDPIANARVTLVPSGQGTPVVLTDRDGRFALTVPLTRAAIAASKSGYSRREVTATPQDESIEIRLSRGAAISGRVLDEFGDPVVGARIVAEAVRAGKNATAVATTDADDRGEYRLGGLGQEAVVIAVVTNSEFVRVNIDTVAMMTNSTNKFYYPDGAATPANAQVLTLRPGEERPSIDFVMPTRQTGTNGDAGGFSVILG